MRRVLKWPVPVDGKAHPIGAGRVLLVGCQDDPGTVLVWTEDDLNDETRREALVIGTGYPVPTELDHIGSVVVPPMGPIDVLFGGPLVWHVYSR